MIVYISAVPSFVVGPHENSRSNFIFSMLAFFSIVLHPVNNMIRVVNSKRDFISDFDVTCALISIINVRTDGSI